MPVGHLPPLIRTSRSTGILLCEAGGCRRRKHLASPLHAKRWLMTDGNRPTRKKRLRVPVLPSEEAAIKKMADSTGLPVAVYLRRVGLGYRVRNILDNRRVEELARVNGDLGRLGGLLKLWLTDDPRTAQCGAAVIRSLLSKIENTMDELYEIMRTVVIPKAKR